MLLLLKILSIELVQYRQFSVQLAFLAVSED